MLLIKSAFLHMGDSGSECTTTPLIERFSYVEIMLKLFTKL